MTVATTTLGWASTTSSSRTSSALHATRLVAKAICASTFASGLITVVGSASCSLTECFPDSQRHVLRLFGIPNICTCFVSSKSTSSSTTTAASGYICQWFGWRLRWSFALANSSSGLVNGLSRWLRFAVRILVRGIAW